MTKIKLLLAIAMLMCWAQVSHAEEETHTSPKYIGVTINPMLASSDTMALPLPLRVNLHAKLFPYSSLILSYGMVDDKPLVVAQSGGYLSEREYTGKILGASIRFHPADKLDGIFGQYSLERINWKKYCFSTRHSCSEADKSTTYEDWAHLTLLGYGKTDIKNIGTYLFGNGELDGLQLVTYISAAVGISWSDSVRTSALIGRLELGFYL